MCKPMDPDKYAAIREALSADVRYAVIEEPEGTKWRFTPLSSGESPSLLVVVDDDFVKANTPKEISAKLAEWRVVERARSVAPEAFVVVTTDGVFIKPRI